MDYFKGKTAVITGSARGIGYATAKLLGLRGAKIVISDIVEDSLAEAEENLSEQGIEVLARRSDVTDPAQCEEFVKAAVDRFGRVDILVNNAGISIVSNFEEIRPEVYKKLIDVNILGCMNMTTAALDSLKESKGHIIFLSSVSGIRAIPTGSIYSCSKAAMRSFAESIRLELKPYGVHVGVISPGFTTTDPRKTVMEGDGTPRPIDRPPHDTPDGVAKTIARLIEKRKREIVTTPLGKATAIVQRISPKLLDTILTRMKLKN